MRTLLRFLFLFGPMALIAAAMILPLSTTWTVIGVVFGLLFFQLALVGSFDQFLPETRRYVALREEVDTLLRLIREMNAAAIQAADSGQDPVPLATPYVAELKKTVERLPFAVGRAAGRDKGVAQRQLASPAPPPGHH